MANRLILGFGHKKRNGKDTAALYAKQVMESWGLIVEVRPFAYPLKEIIGRQMLGLTTGQLYGDLKTHQDSFWGRSPREMLQVIGTDALRQHFDQDVWVKCFIQYAMQNPGHCILVPDVRFPNEARAIQGMGGHVFKVVRQQLDNASDTHES
jgi:hypothetical protein